MIDVLFYTTDRHSVPDELEQKLPEAVLKNDTTDRQSVPDDLKNDAGEVVEYAFRHAKINRINGTSLTLARLTDEEWEKLQNSDITSVEILAAGEDPVGQVLANGGDALTKYRNVWPEQKDFKDEDGNTITKNLPDRFIEFQGDHYYR